MTKITACTTDIDVDRTNKTLVKMNLLIENLEELSPDIFAGMVSETLMYFNFLLQELTKETTGPSVDELLDWMKFHNNKN